MGTLHDWPGDGRLTATGEDVDLLVAWQDQQPRLVLIEAKGFTGWSNKQLLSKALRLGAIFDEQTRRQVDVRLVLVGPKHSTGIVTDGWPSWMTSEHRYHFLAMPAWRPARGPALHERRQGDKDRVHALAGRPEEVGTTPVRG